MYYKATPTSDEVELAEVEWSIDGITFRWDNHPRIGPTRTTWNMERLARFIKRGIVRIENWEKIPDEIRRRLDALVKAQPPVEGWREWAAA